MGRFEKTITNIITSIENIVRCTKHTYPICVTLHLHVHTFVDSCVPTLLSVLRPSFEVGATEHGAAAMSIPGAAAAPTIADSAVDPELMLIATRSDVNRSAAVHIQAGAAEQVMVGTCPPASLGVSSSAAGAAEHSAQQPKREYEEESHLNMMVGIVSAPSWDWKCSTCDKCYNEQVVDRKWVHPRRCPRCKKPMDTWRKRGSICDIFKPPGDHPSPRELKSHARAGKMHRHY